jgi:hypothetical protein
VGLTVLKTQRLNAKDFPTLWRDHQAIWTEMVANGVTFLDGTLPQHERIMADDLAGVIDDMIAVNPLFTTHTENQRLTQKYWSRDFADYIVAQIHAGPVIPRGANP